jgi:hypothetical protein
MSEEKKDQSSASAVNNDGPKAADILRPKEPYKPGSVISQPEVVIKVGIPSLTKSDKG